MINKSILESSMKKKKVDYSHWAKVDTWELIEASLLLANIDPQYLEADFKNDLIEYCKGKGQRFYLNMHIGPTLNDKEISKVRQIYTILWSIDFPKKYSDNTYYNDSSAIIRQSYHQYLIIFEAHSKDLPIPKQLRELIDARYYSETGKSIYLLEVLDNKNDLIKKNTKGSRCANEGLGFLALLLAYNSNQYRNGEAVSANQIKEHVLNMLEGTNIDIRGLDSLNREISRVLQQIKNDYGVDLKSITSKNTK